MQVLNKLNYEKKSIEEHTYRRFIYCLEFLVYKLSDNYIIFEQKKTEYSHGALWMILFHASRRASRYELLHESFKHKNNCTKVDANEKKKE